MTQGSHVINSVGHFDIVGPDLDSLQRFYGRVMGWEIDAQGPGYALVRTPAGSPNGAIADAETPSITIGVIVADVEAALGMAVQAGGSVVMPATDNGWVVKAQIADPAGNHLTLIQG